MSDPNRARELLAEELKPCPIPWCGGLAEMRRGYPDMRERFIICNKCGLKSPHSKPFDEAGIAALWNASALNGERDAIVRGIIYLTPETLPGRYLPVMWITL
jgi:hypothetical protein